MHEINISGSSWHYNLYRWWAANSLWYRRHGFAYRENLCHYMRVILFWAPLLWFFREGRISVWKDTHVEPWKATSVLSLLIGEIALLWWFPSVGRSILLIVSLFIVGLLLMITFAYLHENYSKQVEVVFTAVTFPIWLPLFVMYMAYQIWHERLWYPYVYKPLAKRDRLWLTYLLNGWSLLLLITGILGAVFLKPDVQMKILMAILVVAGIFVTVCTAVTAVFALGIVLKWLQRRQTASRVTQGVEVEERSRRTPGMAKLTWIWVRDAKLGSVLCPLINLPDKPSTYRRKI